MDDKKIAVSVVCIAYNQEKYIAKSLEGMVMQKTSFPFEILVHDDASTDKTADIIREYEKRYPELIKPIYETENLYSKGNGLLGKLMYGLVQGDYVAICEGDDYWIDPLKLQNQYDALENHPNVDICATAALTEKDGVINGEVSPSEKDTIFSAEDVILGGGNFVETATLMMRSKIVKQPREFRKFFSIDYTMQISGALNGGMLFLANKTTVYREMSSSTAWTAKTYSDKEKLILHSKRKEKMLDILNVETKYKYNDVINERKKMDGFNTLLLLKDYKQLASKEYKSELKKQPIKLRAKILVEAFKLKKKGNN